MILEILSIEGPSVFWSHHIGERPAACGLLPPPAHQIPAKVGLAARSRGQCPSLCSRSLRATHSSKVSGSGFGAMSCLIRQTLASRAFYGNRGALHVIDAELGAGIHAEVKFGRVPLKMLGVDMLIHADDAALEDRKEPFKGIGMRVAARPFKLGMVNRFVEAPHLMLENGRAIAHEAAIPVQVFIEAWANAAMVKHNGTDRATAFDEAQNLYVALAAVGMLARLRRAAQFHIVDFNRLSFAAHGAGVAGVHGKPDAMPKVPSGFHAAAKHPLKLARRYAFLRSAKQVDGLKPCSQWQMAVLKNRTLAHRKGGATAGVALAQADLHNAFGVLLARLGTDALQSSNLIAERSAMRTHRAFGPKLVFDVLESRFFAKEPRVGKDWFRHGNLQ